jgi:PAS domain-containing protein
MIIQAKSAADASIPRDVPPREPLSAGAIMRAQIPCALVDASGAVCEANASFDALFPGATAMPLSDRMPCGGDVTALIDGSQNMLHMFYQRQTGERVPAIVQSVPLDRHGSPHTLIVVTDGAPFRKSESKRFESTPCPILRITVDGRITYANADARCTFSFKLPDLIGRPLASLFDAQFESKVAEDVAQCTHLQIARSLDATTSDERVRGGRLVRLVLTPDLGPDGQPLGALVVIQAATQTIRDQIRMLALQPKPESSTKPDLEKEKPSSTVPFWQRQFSRVVECIRQQIDFDHVNFGVYANDNSLFRAVALFPEDSPKWPARWLDLPEDIPSWIASGETWIPDMEAFVARNPDLLKSEVVRCYREYGIKSSVTLLARRGDRATSALTLCSREPGKYGKADLDILQDLDLGPILLQYEENISVDRQRFCSSIKQILDAPGPLRDAAVQTVGEIARHFEWDYAALFRVNRHQERFELFYQTASHGDFLMPENYQQPIGDGMLASTLDGDCVRVVDEIGSPDVEQFGYVGVDRTGPGHRKLKSAMTIPIHLNGRPRWIFNVECETSHAFRGPDEATLKQVIESIEEALKNRMLSETKACLLEETDRGVVIVGTEGLIMELNDTAAAMLEWNENQSPQDSLRLSDFAANHHSRDVLEGDVHTARRRIELRGAKGRSTVVLATRVELDSSFDTALWFLTDVEGVKWNQNLRFLHETVSDVARQTRAPLTLASLIVRELPTMLVASPRSHATTMKTDKLRSISEELLAEIGKADLTFERLADALAIRKTPIRFTEAVNLTHCVADVIECLPERDRKGIDALVPEECLLVAGDSGRLTFVVRSLLSYLVRIRWEDSATVTVTLRSTGQNVLLDLKLPRSPVVAASSASGATDALALAAREAREAASLALHSIRRIVRAHHGSLRREADAVTNYDGSPRWRGFALVFPRA